MWLLGRLIPDHKTVANFGKNNGRAIGKVCARFVELRRKMDLLVKASVAIDGSNFKGGEQSRSELHAGEGGTPPSAAEQSVAR